MSREAKMDELSMTNFLVDLRDCLQHNLNEEGEALIKQGIPKNRLTVFRHFHLLETTLEGVNILIKNLREFDENMVNDIEPQCKKMNHDMALTSFAAINKSTSHAITQILAQLFPTFPAQLKPSLPANYFNKEHEIKNAIMDVYAHITIKASNNLRVRLNIPSASIEG